MKVNNDKLNLFINLTYCAKCSFRCLTITRLKNIIKFNIIQYICQKYKNNQIKNLFINIIILKEIYIILYSIV